MKFGVLQQTSHIFSCYIPSRRGMVISAVNTKQIALCIIPCKCS